MKKLNIGLLIIGAVLLASGYFGWATAHEDVTVRTAQNILLIVPGRALAAMGYLGPVLAGKRSA